MKQYWRTFPRSNESHHKTTSPGRVLAHLFKRSRFLILIIIPIVLLVLLRLNYITTFHTRSTDNNKPGVISEKSSYYEAPVPVKIITGAESTEVTPGEGTITHIINELPKDQGQNFIDNEKINKKLNKYKEFREFLDKQLFQNILTTRPTFPSINNPEHYNQSNSHHTGIEGRMPVSLGKLRENNGVDPTLSMQCLLNFPQHIAQNFKGNGILYAGGGEYNWLVLLSIRLLRNSGSVLPVEVFIPNEDEYSIDLCERVFPAFGASCLLMSNYINTTEIEVKGYQLKSIALLLTSFENVLMMDSDNLSLKNPDTLFVNEPFVSKPLVIWPDLWRRSTSPIFYDVAGIQVNETNQVRFSFGDERDHPEGLKTIDDFNSKISYHDIEGTFPEASSETGQILINKKIHAKTIFLSLYYNYWGPNYYYPLFAQGQAGEGDKETLLAAAHKFGLPYYQVQEYIREYGEIYGNGDIEIAAMGQYDPILDYMQTRNPKTFKSEFPYDRTKDNYLMHRFKNSEMMFLHCNQPKLYPWKINGNGFRHVHDGDGKPRRLYSKLLIKELGYDFEARIWEAMKWLVCEQGDLKLQGLVGEAGNWCEKVSDHLSFLKKDKL
ncbi:unnamed protein product [Wickerhamomyces anomalus]